MRNVLRVIVLLVALLLAFINSRPAAFHVERSATIAAPGEVVFAQVGDFHNWKAWSPWEKLDPHMQVAFEGPPAGVGSAYHWTGNDKVGEGRMTILESDPGRRLAVRLDMLKPWKSTNTCAFDLTPAGTGTHVTWSMDGHNNFLMKTMSVFESMDKMVGPDYERGLANLKQVAEAAPPPAAPAPAATDAAAAAAKPAKTTK